ncbi:hypothetical protein Tco_0552270 [Tanacetum coccineum]
MSEENKVLQAQLHMKHEKELSNLRSSENKFLQAQLLMKHEKELSNLRSSVELSIAAHKPLLARSSIEKLDEPPKDHGCHSSRDIHSGSGGAVAPDIL